MKIKYSKKRLNIHYKLGLCFISIGVFLKIAFSLIFNSYNKLNLDSAGIGLIGAGICTLGIYYFEKKKQYLTIENGHLKKNGLFQKKINLNEIQQIKKFAGDYILKTKKMELTIDTQIIDENSLLELNKELNNLNLE